MKTILTILTLLISTGIYSQQRSTGDIPIDSLYSYLQGKVSYCPPSDFDILKWFSYGDFPTSSNGWAIEFKSVSAITGWTEGECTYIINITCDTCGYLKKYSNDIHLSYGHDDKTSVTITQNKDSTDKYFYIKYPELEPKIKKHSKTKNK